MLVDLTLPVMHSSNIMTTKKFPVKQDDGVEYNGVIHHFSYDSMVSTYIDFPGHIEGLGDGTDAANYPVSNLYRIKALVIKLNRTDKSGEVSARELKNSINLDIDVEQPSAVIINALGTRDFNDIEERSVWLGTGAVEWLISLGIHLLVSDIYESRGIHGIFGSFFKKGISTVCYPVNLSKIKSNICHITVFPLKIEKAQQLPCRIVAEFIGGDINGLQ